MNIDVARGEPVLVHMEGRSDRALTCAALIGVTASLFGASLISSAHAAGTDDDQANIPVRQRAHPQWDAKGIRFGDLFFYPTVTAGAAFDSNVFASHDSPMDDFALVVSPELRVRMDRSNSSHELDLGASYYGYERFDNQDRTEAHASLKSKREFGNQIDLQTLFAAARKFELPGDSSSPTGSAKPIGYDELRAETVVTKTFNQLGVSLGAGLRNLTYEDGMDASGMPIDQSFRDGTVISGSVKPFYDFSPGFRAFARLQANQQDYEGTGSLNRDSKGFNAGGGLEFLISPMLFGSVEAGYLGQRYDDPAIPKATGLSALGHLTWLATPLMTVSLLGSRAVAETAAQGQEARIDISGGIEVDYEIKRNLIANLETSYVNEDFQGTRRNDDVLSIKTGFDYSLNEYIHFGLKYSYLERQSNISTFSFDKHQVMMSVIAQY